MLMHQTVFFSLENLSCTAKSHPKSTQTATWIVRVLQHFAGFPVTSHETISRAAIQAGKSRKANRLVDVNSTWPKHMIRHVLLRDVFDCKVGNPLSNHKHTAEMSQQEEGGFHTTCQLLSITPVPHQLSPRYSLNVTLRAFFGFSVCFVLLQF